MIQDHLYPGIFQPAQAPALVAKLEFNWRIELRQSFSPDSQGRLEGMLRMVY